MQEQFQYIASVLFVCAMVWLTIKSNDSKAKKDDKKKDDKKK